MGRTGSIDGDVPVPDATPQSPAPNSLRFPRWLVSLVILASLVPAVLLAITVARYAVDVPYYDEWGMTPLIRKSIDGKPIVRDLFAQYTGHRLVFPKLVQLATARATGWDTRFGLAINFVLGCTLAGILVGRAPSFSKENRSASCLVLAPVIALVSLSLAQYENWMWGWQVAILLAVLASVSALVLLGRPRLSLPGVIAAIALSVVATFSFANGILLWPIGLLAIVLPGLHEHPIRRDLAMLWSIAAVASLALYFHNFTMPQEAGTGTEHDGEVGSSIAYLFAYLGAPFALFEARHAIVIGALGLLMVVALLAYVLAERATWSRACVAPTLLCLFGAGSGVLTGFGRAGFGATQALSSRYVTFSNLFWIGLLLLMATAFYGPDAFKRFPRAARPAHAALLGLLVLITAATIRADVRGVESIRQFSHLERTLRFKLLQGHRDDQLLLLAPNIENLDRWVRDLQKHRLWAWRPNAPSEMFEPPTLLTDD